MMREHLRLRKITGIRRDEYILYGLFMPNMSFEAKSEYLGGQLVRRLWSAFNPIEYRYLFKNKLVFKRLCLAASLPTAPLLAVFDPDRGCASDGAPLRNEADLHRWMDRLEDPGVVFKPAAGAEGQMIKVFTARLHGPALVDLGGEAWSPRRLYQYLTDASLLEKACSGAPDLNPTFLVERRLRPHPALAPLSPDTLCTLRVLTLCDRGCRTQVVSAVYKLQTGLSGADNLARGSVAVAVDTESGTLGTGWVKPKRGALPAPARLEADPTTGRRFTGMSIPMYHEALSLALRAADAFPWARVVGWDIAVTPDGPFLVEGNWSWGERLIQGGGNRGLYHGDFRRLADRLIAEGKARRAEV